jgi:uncharacterized protein
MSIFTVSDVNVSLAFPLSEAEISVLVLPTYTTDYLLIKEANVERALWVLELVRHCIER